MESQDKVTVPQKEYLHDRQVLAVRPIAINVLHIQHSTGLLSASEQLYSSQQSSIQPDPAEPHHVCRQASAHLLFI